MTNQAAQPLLWVLPTPKDEEEVNRDFRKAFVTDFQETRQYFREQLTDWFRNPQRRLATYQANEPVFIVSGDLLAWWFESQDEPGATVAPPGMVEELLMYWGELEPQPPPAPEMTADPKTGQQTLDPELAQQYHAAYQAYEAEAQAWNGRMLRLSEGMVLPGDVLGPYWRALHEWRPGLATDTMRDYARLTNREVKRQEKREAITSPDDLLLPEVMP